MMDPLTLTVHGAAETVTGSCFEVAAGRHRLLVDCGLFQGSRSLEKLNHEPFAFDPAGMDAVLLTHAHIDHSGLLPRLAAQGFAGSIWCTAPTADLLGEMLPDAARIQEQEAQRRNRRADRADEPPVAPLYTYADAERALALLRPVPLDSDFEPAPAFSARLWNAGHILGAASIELRANGVRMLFSGDLGPRHKAFQADAEGPAGLDHLFCESTYGDREREEVPPAERRRRLKEVVEEALALGGNLVIPAFALERTQELLLDLALLIRDGGLRQTPIFIDSPLATRTTEIFHRHGASLEEADAGIFRHPAFHFVEAVEASMRLNRISGAIILSASGMCEAGRIRHHLRHNLPRRDSTILFVGFQAQGTLGRALRDGAGRVRISGRDVAVRARVRSIEAYSAHADRDELIAWIRARQPIAGTLFLTHGEPAALGSLRDALSVEIPSIRVPAIGERYELAPAAAAKRIATGRTDLKAAIGRDWQNDYADFAVNLKRELQRIGDEAKRRKALAAMRRILEAHRRGR